MKLLCILLFTSQFCLAQTIFIKDKLTKEEVPYAIVKLDSLGFYTDVNGSIDVSKYKFKNILVTHLSYETQKLNVTSLTDTIWLNPLENQLEEVVIRDFSNKKKKHLKTPPKFFNNLLIIGTETVSCLRPKKNIENTIISSFIFEISENKKLNNPQKLKDLSISLRLNFYSSENLKPVEAVNSVFYEKLSINKMLKNNNQLILNLENELISIEKKGFCFGIEILDYFEDEKQVDGIHLSINTSKNKSKYFDSKLYLRYPINDNEIISHEDFHKKIFELRKIKDVPVLIPEMILYK